MSGPLCVPSRLSLLTGHLPSKTGVYTNFGNIPEDNATFVHSIAAEGYETVLCGRMHFLGYDQRHGFTKRLIGDFLPSMWAWCRDKWAPKELGPYDRTLSIPGALKVYGGGTSPVLEYDKAVIEMALDYLKQEHSKPQFIVVGTYGPHCSYVAPTNLYQHYKDKVRLPISLEYGYEGDQSLALHFQNVLMEEEILGIRAAYCGMVTQLDDQIGMVKRAWEQYLSNNQQEGLFIYASTNIALN